MRNYLPLALIALAGPCFNGAQQRPAHPEALSGPWEVSDGHQGHVGFHLTILEHDTLAISLGHTALHTEVLLIGVYGWTDHSLSSPHFGFFSTNPDGGAHWDGKHLRIDSGPVFGNPAVHLALQWDEQVPGWTGFLQRGSLRQASVRLTRPAGGGSPFLGTWSDATDPTSHCLHIARSQDGVLFAWSDILQIPANPRADKGIHVIPALQIFGQLDRAFAVDGQSLRLEFNAYSPSCCIGSYLMRLTSTDATGRRGAARNDGPAIWEQQSGDSCEEASNLPATTQRRSPRQRQQKLRHAPRAFYAVPQMQ